MCKIIGRNNKETIYLSSKNSEKHILWELESHCQLNCRYCYPSRTPKGHLSFNEVENIVKKLNESSLKFIHITGGEPTLSPFFQYIVNHLKGKNICITTNLVDNLDLITKVLLECPVYSVAVSLDSIDPNTNNYLRGQTDVVINNIINLLNIKAQYQLKTKIRVHCVLTKINLNSAESLLYWAKAHGIDEVSCQPVSIEKSHLYYKQLSLDVNDIPQLNHIYSLEALLFNSSYAIAHSTLMHLFLSNEHISIENSNVVCSPYIDSNGTIWNCPLKKFILKDFFNNNTSQCEYITFQCMTQFKRFDVRK